MHEFLGEARLHHFLGYGNCSRHHEKSHVWCHLFPADKLRGTREIFVHAGPARSNIRLVDSATGGRAYVHRSIGRAGQRDLRVELAQVERNSVFEIRVGVARHAMVDFLSVKESGGKRTLLTPISVSVLQSATRSEIGHPLDRVSAELDDTIVVLNSKPPRRQI